MMGLPLHVRNSRGSSPISVGKMDNIGSVVRGRDL
jgi:hypothetical protein